MNWQWVIVVAVVAFVAIVVMLYLSAEREKTLAHEQAMARLMVEAWEKTLALEPIGVFAKSQVQPVPNLVSPAGPRMRRWRNPITREWETEAETTAPSPGPVPDAPPIPEAGA